MRSYFPAFIIVLAQGSAAAQTPATAPTAASAATESDLTRLPELMHFVTATYPERAVREQVQAEVVLAIDIDADGRVEHAEVVTPAQPQGYGFDEAALAAVAQFVFTPALANDEPVPVRITYRYVFTLTPKPTDAPSSLPAPLPVANFVGQLRTRGTRAPQKGVTVTVFRGEGEDTRGLETTTDADGYFRFFDLAPGDWRVFVDPPGHFPVRVTETLIAGERLEVNYLVEKQDYNPFDVLVTALRPVREVNRATLSAQEIERIPGAFGDPLAVVTNLPSVARPVGGMSDEIIVRGASPEDTRTYVNGVEVPYLYHFGGLRSVIPAGMLEAIDFYPGNFSASYGRGTGGVLDVRPKELKPERLGGYADVSILDTGIYLEAPLGDIGAIAIAGRRSYLDFLLNAAIPEDAPVKMSMAPRYYDYQVLGTLRLSENQRLKVFFYGANDEMRMLFKNAGDIAVGLDSGKLGAEISLHRGVVEHLMTLGPGLVNELSLAVGRDKETEDVFGTYHIYLTSWQEQLRDTLRWQVAQPLRLNVGLDLIRRSADWDVHVMRPPDKEGERAVATDADVVRTAKATVVENAPAAFLEAEWTPTARLLVVPGVRIDRMDGVDEVSVDPRLTLRFGISDALTVKGGVGQFHQQPTDDELHESFGNPALRSESSWHTSLGAEYKPLPQLTVDATAFYKTMSHLIARSDALIERDGRWVPEVYNNHGRGRVYGIDLLVRHDFAHNFFGWIAYTLSRAERHDPGFKGYRPFDYDQTHILTVLGNYRLPHNWEIGMRWRLVSGNPDTPFTGGVYDADADTYLPVSGRYNSDRLPSFQQLDLRVDKHWIFDSYLLTAYMDIQNVTNRENAEAYAYSADYRHRQPASGMPLMSIVGIRAEF